MTDSILNLLNPPIVEAILDLDCDFPPGWELEPLKEAATDRLRGSYPNVRSHFVHETRIEARPDGPEIAPAQRRLGALQFLREDGKELIQFRAGGYSFNRLAPYAGLDSYLPGIRETWAGFRETAKPLRIRVVRLRYINRILLPATEGKVRLEEFLEAPPRLPPVEDLQFNSFLTQYAAVEAGTGHHVNVVLTSQPVENGSLPVILDNCVAAPGEWSPNDWGAILKRIESLRALKNRVFHHTLTEKCLNLFQ